MSFVLRKMNVLLTGILAILFLKLVSIKKMVTNAFVLKVIVIREVTASPCAAKAA